MQIRFVYLIRAGVAGDAFTEVVRTAASVYDTGSVKLTWTSEAPPRASVVPFRSTAMAAIGVATPREPSWPRVPDDYRVAGYEVETSVPLRYERDWADGELTPGVSLLTCFRRKPGLDDERFLRHWFEVHGPLGARIHPLWAYVRNRVRRPLRDSEPLCAIVEEQLRAREDLTNPVRFFGGALRMLPNMVREWLDVRAFIDFNHFEAYLAREVWLRS